MSLDGINSLYMNFLVKNQLYCNIVTKDKIAIRIETKNKNDTPTHTHIYI